MKKWKKCCLWVIIILISISFVGCDPVFRYEGEHKDLEVTAIYSLLGIESLRDDQILVLEQDEYGRTLFATCLGGNYMLDKSFEECILAVLVMQKSDASYAYFYGEQNYIMTIVRKPTDLTVQLVNTHFPDDMISELKLKNHWGSKPADNDDILVQVPLSVWKENELSNHSKKLIEQEIGSNYRYVFYRADASGRKLYFVLHIEGKPVTYEWYVAIIDAEGNLENGNDSIMKLSKESMAEIPIVLSKFMADHNWKDISATPTSE